MDPGDTILVDPLLLPPPPGIAAAKPLDGVSDYRGQPVHRGSSGGWRSALFVVSVEIAGSFAFFGISANLITYMTGPLGQSNASAAASVNAWSGTASLMPLLGAFLADAHLGRYRSIILACSLYTLGFGMLTLSSTVPALRPSLQFTPPHGVKGRATPHRSRRTPYEFLSRRRRRRGKSSARMTRCLGDASRTMKGDGSIDHDKDTKNSTIYVGGLDPTVNKEELKHRFGQYGEVVYVRILSEKKCGFVKFSRRASAEVAIEKLDGQQLGGSPIRLSFALQNQGPLFGGHYAHPQTYDSYVWVMEEVKAKGWEKYWSNESDC